MRAGWQKKERAASYGWRLVAIMSLCAATLACAPGIVRPKGSMQPVPVRPEEVEGAYVPKRMALLIGINNFDDSRWRPLRYAEKDAIELGKAFSDPALGRFDSVKVLTGANKTTRAEILKAIDLLIRANTNKLDTVVIYFSAHGTLERDSGGVLKQFIVASDTRFDDIVHTGLSVFELKEKFASLKSTRKTLIFATCHSGQGKSELPPGMSDELRRTKAGFLVKPLDTVSEASVILSACAWGETAREDDKLQHDIYTNFLIEALRKYDPNENGAVTVSEAHDYAREKTYYYTQGQQRATAVSDILGSDPIVLSGKIIRPGKPAIYSYNEDFQNIELVSNGVPKGKFPGSIIMETGVWNIKLVGVDGISLFDRRVALKDGVRVDAAALIKEAREEQSMGMGVAYKSFISADVTDSLYAPIMTYGVLYSRRGPLGNTRMDISLFGGTAVQDLVIDGVEREAEFVRVDLEGELLWEYRMGRLQFAGGPAVGVLFLQRRFGGDMEEPNQYLVTALLGPAGNVEFLATPKWILGLGAEVNAAQFMVDSSGRFELGYAATLYLKYRL